jgi:hypothetical protein
MDMRRKVCKGVRGLMCAISQRDEDESWKRSTRVQRGEDSISIHQLHMNTNRNQFQRIDSHGPECKCSVCLVMLLFPVKVISRQEKFPNLPFSAMHISVVGECFGGLEIEMDSSF